jgi:hypothetical protein
MKMQRKNRIINTNTTSVGFIFLASNCSINPKKNINLNKTKLYHKDNNYITIVKSAEWKKQLETIIDKKYVENVIDIYRNRLYVIHVNYDAIINGYSERLYLDLFNSMSSSIYNDVYFYNKNCKECYLRTIIKDSNNVFQLTIKDLYYYLIGYI